MRILCAIDSFKGSLTSLEVALAAKEGILRVNKHHCVDVLPLGDGGEGTMEAILGPGAKMVCTTINYPDGSEGDSSYAVLNDGMVVIESAKAVGLTLIPVDRRDPMILSSVGLGQLIMHAYSNNYRKFLITLGGSGTNDGGTGMLYSMGVRFKDSDGKDLSPNLCGLAGLSSIEVPDSFTEIVNSCSFTVASDVNNPLCGDNGASRVFGPQKGLKEADIKTADDILLSYGLMSDILLHKNNVDFPGGGAAGGLGFALVSYLEAELVSGAMAVIERNDVERLIIDSDLVISGEGRIDSQTLMGKGTGIIKNLADKYHKRVLFFAGCTKDEKLLNDAGLEFYSIDPGGMTVEELMDNKQASINLKNKVVEVIDSLNLSD